MARRDDELQMTRELSLARFPRSKWLLEDRQDVGILFIASIVWTGKKYENGGRSLFLAFW
jgi:hypothetical protein